MTLHKVLYSFAGNIATGEEALSLLDCPRTRNLFLDDLLEVSFCLFPFVCTQFFKQLFQ